MNARGLTVDGGRIAGLVEEFAKYTDTPGAGVTRLAFTPKETEAQTRLSEYLCQEAGYSTVRDFMGNLIARPPQFKWEEPAITIMSHIDSVPNGGALDGMLGLIVGAEVCRIISDANCMKKPVQLISFVAEESSRFGRAFLGSGVMSGKIDEDDFDTLIAVGGQKFWDATGFHRKMPSLVQGNRPAMSHVLEFHIEQGPVLDRASIPVGIVTSIAKATRIRAWFHGRADHSGTTPMSMRRDALVAAAEGIVAIEAAGRDLARAANGVATVGTLQVKPGAMNVVPEQVCLGIDVRAGSNEAKRATVKAIRNSLVDIAATRHIVCETEIIEDGNSVELSTDLARAIGAIARDSDLEYCYMMSGAGHDCMNFADRAPTGMIFVPSRNGHSHSAAEHTPIEEILPGAQLFLDTVLHLMDG
jgi:N-carbamoyl-L-amino-acid hydrolase